LRDIYKIFLDLLDRSGNGPLNKKEDITIMSTNLSPRTGCALGLFQLSSIGADDQDGPVADEIRDRMDPYWRILSEDDETAVRNLACILNELEDVGYKIQVIEPEDKT
jgi:hypothetical protein